jgi:hypothetical protein
MVIVDRGATPRRQGAQWHETLLAAAQTNIATTQPRSSSGAFPASATKPIAGTC